MLRRIYYSLCWLTAALYYTSFRLENAITIPNVNLLSWELRPSIAPPDYEQFISLKGLRNELSGVAALLSVDDKPRERHYSINNRGSGNPECHLLCSHMQALCSPFINAEFVIAPHKSNL